MKVINIIIDDNTLIRKFNKLLINLQIFYFIKGGFDGFLDLLGRSFFIDVIIENIIEIYNLLNKKFKKSPIKSENENISLKIYDAKVIIENIVKSYIQNNVLEYIWLSNRNEYSLKNICNNLYFKYYDENEIGNYKSIKILFPDNVLDIFFGSDLLSIYKDIYIYEIKTSKLMSGGSNKKLEVSKSTSILDEQFLSTVESDKIISIGDMIDDILIKLKNKYNNYQTINDTINKIFNIWQYKYPDKKQQKSSIYQNTSLTANICFELIDLYTLINRLSHDSKINKSSTIINNNEYDNEIDINNINSIELFIKLIKENIKVSMEFTYDKIVLYKIIDLFCIFNKF